MAELRPNERLQPCLLDRLTDEEPDNPREGRDRRIVSFRRYRQAVLRDLAWLLNTANHPARDGLEEFGEVARSVLNYGIPDMCGLNVSGAYAEQIEQHILQAIRCFEPRIIRDGASVRTADVADAAHNALSFEIVGELWAQPMPDPLYIKTEVDLETGQCEIKDRPGG